MPSFLSPGEYILERDMSTTVPGVATSIAAYVGAATWGPVFVRTQVTNEKTYSEQFGVPTDETYEDFFTVAGFLKYASTIIFVRAVDPAYARNAQIGVTTAGTITSTSGDYIPDWETMAAINDWGTGEKLRVYGKFPGEFGNTNFNVAVLNYRAYTDFTTNPTSAWSAETTGCSAELGTLEYGPASANEFVVQVYLLNTDGKFELAENFLVSDTAGAKDHQGNNMYVEDAINNASKYILAFNHTTIATQPQAIGASLLAGGMDGMPGASDIIDGYETYFGNTEDIEINYLIGGSHTTVSIAKAIVAVAVQRADCFAILDCPKTDMVGVASLSDAVQNTIDYRKVRLNENPSYAALYANWLYIYDKYNDVNRWVPSSGHVAGVYAYTADTTDAWWAPAGLNRGIFRNVIKVAMNPSKAFRDTMYVAQVNPIVSFPGQGIVVWGQKTLQTKPSAFDRVNVRLLFNYMEKAIAISAKYVTFEPNDNLTRATFKNMVIPFMEDIKGRRGVYDYLVDVSDKVNTPERIDRNEFWCEIYVKPTRAAEFIVVRFTATKTGVDFAELQ